MNISEWKNKYIAQGAFVKNSAVLFLGGLGVNVMNYVFHLVIGRQVDVRVYGEAESLISLITIVSVPAATLTLVAAKYAAVCKADGNHHGSREIFAYLNRQVLKYGLPVFLLALAATPLVGSFLKIQNNFALIFIWIAMYLSFFNAVNSGLLQGWQQFRQVSLANLTVAGTKLAAAVALVAAGFALTGIVGGMLLAAVVGYLVTLSALRSKVMTRAEAEKDHCQKAVDFQALRRYITPVFAGSLAINLLGYADMVLAKRNLSDLDAGAYGALTVTSKIIFFATGVVASVLFSMSAENDHKGTSSRQMLRLALALVLGISGAATLIYFFFPKLILGILFGSKYAAAAPYLGWFALAVALYSVSNIIYQYLLSIRRTKVSYAFLGIALLALTGFLFFGHSIPAMLTVLIISQLAAVMTGIGFLIMND